MLHLEKPRKEKMGTGNVKPHDIGSTVKSPQLVPTSGQKYRLSLFRLVNVPIGQWNQTGLVVYKVSVIMFPKQER